MITLYDIVESASLRIKGTLVLHRSMIVHTTFKAYKIFKYDLYHIDDDNKVLLFTFKENRKALSDELDKVWEECDRVYLNKFIEWLTGNDFKALIDGI